MIGLPRKLKVIPPVIFEMIAHHSIAVDAGRRDEIQNVDDVNRKIL